jgi:predicted ATPase
MRLLEIGIQNFKSLRSVSLKPGPLSVFIGPNGAGKSNLCDALDFIGEMHRDGLERAIVSRGGFANLLFREPGDVLVPLSFSITAALSKYDLQPARNGHANGDAPRDIVVKHQLTIGPGTSITTEPFRITSESIRLDGKLKGQRSSHLLAKLVRDQEGVRLTLPPPMRELSPVGGGASDAALESLVRTALQAKPLLLLPALLESLLLPSIPTASALGEISVFQMTQAALRKPGVPSPAPRLGRDGANLPAVLAWLKEHDLKAFHSVVNAACSVMPSLDDIDIVPGPAIRGGLELTFQELGFPTPWREGQISDGTLQAIGLVTALLGPGSSVVAIDEPENSLHPWSIWQFIDALRQANEVRQVFLTTHSPVLINQIRPDDIWVVSKPGSETTIGNLVEIDPIAKTGWDAGEFTIAEYLESGIVPGSAPTLSR